MAKKKTTRKKKAVAEAGDDKKPTKQGQATAKKKRAGTKAAARTPQKSDGQGKSRKDCVVVGIGASAGGLESYKRLLRSMPDDTGMAFVLVQHLDPSHESMMVQLLSKYTSMPVLQIDNAMPIQPNHVYMIPPNKFTRIKDGGLFLEAPINRRGVRLPIDYFFQSLAEARKERAICIILSGTGSDGAVGLRDVKAEGGMTIVQQPDGAEYDGMPRAAISTGAVDFVLPIEEMAEVIVPYAEHPYVQTKSNVTLADSAPDQFRAILNLLRAHTDQDFTCYKKGTLTRRIDRRMGIRQLSDPTEYLKLLREDSDEVRGLFQDLLIGVTRFFREPQAWDELKDLLSRRILEKQADGPFRVWVPGCSTGEEAYSIAMLLYEQQERQSRRIDVQVFATDIDREAIDTARLGLYPENITKDIPETRIDAYFHREGDKLRVKKRLRESCIFAVQNLLSDPPFSGLDLISCRNLLIYLETDVQKRIFEMFHFSLKREGLLFLGSSESPSRRKGLFETISQSSRLYRKVGDTSAKSGSFPVGSDSKRRIARDGTVREHGEFPLAVGAVEMSKRALLEEFAPASVVVNQRGLIQYIHGPVRDYLDFPTGEPDLDLAMMALDGLKAKTRTALHRARSEGELVSLLAPRVTRNGGHVAVRVRVQPLPRVKGSDPLYLVSFFDEAMGDQPKQPAISDETEHGETTAEAAVNESINRSDRQLALELQATREDLQSTIEELESANEELKASNEEITSMNEELQSTNEELETSREELQSLNEELSTVNNQLHDKVEELEATTNDLTNLLASTDMATLFLDSNLRIRRFTPATVRLMSLLDSDVGRPLSDLAPRVDDPDMVADVQIVLDQLAPIEKEVKNSDGHSYMRRITPFRTADNKIEGVVITFSDVTMLKEASERLEFRERQQGVIAQLGRAALAGEGLMSLFEKATQELAVTLNVDYTKVLKLNGEKKELQLVAGVGWEDGLVGNAAVPTGIDSQGGFTLQSASAVIVKDLTKEKRFSGPQLLTDHGVISGMSTIIGPEESPWGVLGIHARREIEFTIDDTNFIVAVANVLWDAIRRRRDDIIVSRQLAEIDSTYKATPTGLCLLDTDLRYVRVNSALAKFNGISIEDHLGRTIREVVPDLADTLEPIFRRVIETGEPELDVEVRGNRLGNPDSENCWLASYSPLIIDGEVKGVNASVVEITERIAAEQALAGSRARLQRLIDSASIGIAFAKPDGTVLNANDALLEMFSITREEFEQQGWDWEDRVLPHDERFAEVMQRLGTSLSTEAIEIRRQDADHDSVWVLASARPLDDDSDEYVAFLVDITQQKQAELALIDSEERLRLAARLAGFGTYYADLSHGRLTWSSEFKQILGMKPEDPVPVGIGEVPEFIHPEDRERVAEKLKASLDPAGKGEFHDEHRIVRPDGDIRWLMMQGRTLFRGKKKDRRPTRIAGTVLDMTDRHKFEEQLQEARQSAEAANEAKSLFLANTSHEIRTPMTAILGFADILHGRLEDPDDKKCIETIKQNGDHLCQILNDVLDLAKIESGKLQVRLENCDVISVLSNIRSLLAVRATEKGIDLSIDFDGQIPQVIETDTKMLRQILLNLIGNAIKFTQQGHVRTVVTCAAERQRLEMAVIDTGVGIDPERLEILFNPFEQVDNSATRSAGGTGLGLSITKKLVETLGGEIEVESAAGQGSTFRVSLPTGPLDDAEWMSPDSHTLSEGDPTLPPHQLPTITGKVLAVDDRREIRFLVEEFLETAGAEVVSASNGVQAIETWVEQRDQNNGFDTVVMDIQMPEMDGLEATRQLRAEGYEGPIIALTANALRKDRAACLEAGCNDFIAKPIDRAELVQKVGHWINNSPAKAQPQPKAGLMILVIDDHEATCSMQQIMLEQCGHQVTTAGGGAQALAAVENFAPNAVLMDLGLGDMTGTELIGKLKQMPHLAESNFICLTGRQEYDVPWRELGFDHFLQKPADIEDIERALAKGKTG